MNDNIDNATPEELVDRLIDRALTERLGDDVPPDLSERILARTEASQRQAPVAQSTARRPTLVHLLTMAVAATLLIGTVSVIMSPVLSSRQTARGLQHAGKEAAELRLTFDGAATDKRNNLDLDRFRAGGQKSASSNERSQTQLELEGPPAEPIVAGTPVLVEGVQREKRETWGAYHNRQTDSHADKSGYPMPRLEAAAGRSDSGRVLHGYALEGRKSDLSGRPGQPAQLPEQLGWPTASATRGTQTGRRFRIETEVGQQVDRYLIDFETDSPDGQGPGLAGDRYAHIADNPFVAATGEQAVSTFSIDVDTAAYANVRQFVMQGNRLPPPDAVRIEELVNYFDYSYPAPDAGTAPSPSPSLADRGGEPKEDSDLAPQATRLAPFSAHVEVAGCPWKPEHRLVRIGIKGRELARDKRPQSNLVFLIDVSGSMNSPNKLPLVIAGMQALTRELGENDRVAIVVYASREGLVLPSTPGTEQETILAALGNLRAGGSTAGGAGIQLAYQIAEDHFIDGGVNRVILCTDGDFNVGTTGTGELQRLVEKKAKNTGVFLSVLGFGRGNLNDDMMEAISGHGNGNYCYIDNHREARKVLVEEMTGTLVTIAKDVKIQVEFNPAQVAGYRLIGYENRMLAAQDFNDDTKDAGEIGAGHTVTALYELVPAGQSVPVAKMDELKYQQPTATPADHSSELLTLKMRYKQPDEEKSRKLEWPITDHGAQFSVATEDFKFAAAVASFGMLLRDSPHRGNATWSAVEEIASEGVGPDTHGRRAEFVHLVRYAKKLAGGED